MAVADTDVASASAGAAGTDAAGTHGAGAGVAATRTVRSFCRVCTSVCGILVETAGDQVLRVRGDRDHPMSAGYTCPKGRALPGVHHHPDRLERPLLRDGDALRPTTWEECLDDLGTRVRAIIDEHGPSAVGIFFGSGVGMDAAGYKLAQSLHRAIGTPAKFSPLTIDGTAKVLISDLVGGTPALAGRPDYDTATFVLFVGSNPVVSHGHTVAMPNPIGTLKALRDRGEIWVVDPRHTETAKLATGHLAPRPGTDHAVLAYLVREVLRDGARRDVLESRCVDVDVLTAAVEPFTLEHTAAVCDVPADELTALLAAVRRAERVAVETGTGVTMSASANVTQWLGWALMIITGSMNQPGGAWFHPGFASRLENVQLPVSPADGSFGPGPRSRPETHSFLGEWPCAVLADEIEAGNIRAVLNLGGHLVTAFPDTETLVPALRKLDVFATIEIIANETTALSTHVLPTKDQLERADITLWDNLMPRVATQYTPAVVEPVGDRRSTWWVLAELGRRLGHELADTSGEAATDGARLAKVVPRDTFGEDLTTRQWAETDRQLPAPWVERHLDRLGGWRLAPRLLVDQLAGLTEPAPLVFVPRRQKRHLNSQFDFLGAEAEILVHPDDAATAGVRDGEPLVVRTAHGEITGIARVDPAIRRGAVSIPHGHQSANVNRLTDKNDLDPVTGMAHYSGVPVAISPA